MGGLTDELHDFLDANRVGVLATLAGDGQPRQSVVYYARDGETLLVSTESKRLKARDVQRSGWASLCVLGHEPPEPQTDEALAAIDRVILAITVQRVSAASYIPARTAAAPAGDAGGRAR
jgi:hypothetical protein